MSTRNKRSIGIASKAAALACGALLAMAATPAAAVVHTFTNVNKSVTYSFQNNVMELQSFDVAGFAVQFGFSGNAGQSENPFILGNNQLGLLKVPFSSTLQNLAAGATIAPVQNLYTQVTAGLFEGVSNSWVTANVVEGYVGLFTALSGLHFGYAHFRYDDPNNTITLLDYSYEDSPGVGLTVTAVPVPEPGTWALALLGLAVVANKARRLKSAA